MNAKCIGQYLQIQQKDTLFRALGLQIKCLSGFRTCVYRCNWNGSGGRMEEGGSSQEGTGKQRAAIDQKQ